MDRLRHVMIAFVALALMVGTGWQSCATKQRQSSSVVASHRAMGHHDHMASSQHGGDTKSQGDSHACLKCCGACMLGSIALLAPEWSVTRVMSRASFPSPDVQLRSHIVFVDPDIPKSVA